MISPVGPLGREPIFLSTGVEILCSIVDPAWTLNAVNGSLMNSSMDHTNGRESKDRKRVLAVYFSQTGQVGAIIDSVLAPLRNDPDIEVVTEMLEPEDPYPFPWSMPRFFGVLPECVAHIPPRMKPCKFDPTLDYDLIILGYQPWYLSPSLPTTGFLASPEAARVLKGKPVITFIGCRGMWMMGQEQVKRRLTALGATLCDNVVLVDRGSAAATLFTTPRWMLTGKKDRFMGVMPAAGILEQQVAEVARFGDVIRRALHNGPILDQQPVLEGYGAVKVTPRHIWVERCGRGLFMPWGRAARACGEPASQGGHVSLARHAVLILFAFWLLLAVLTLLPIGVFLILITRPFMRKKEARDVAYFEGPSGSRTTQLG